MHYSGDRCEGIGRSAGAQKSSSRTSSCPLEREAEEPLNALRTHASQELRLLSAGTELRVE